MRVGRAVRWLSVLAVLAALLGWASQSRSAGSRATAPVPQQATLTGNTTTRPSATSAASLYLSNRQNATGNYGPRTGELHYSGSWGVNQIARYSGFFRNETDSVKYEQIHTFASSAYLDDRGTLHGQYGSHNGQNTPINVSGAS